MCYSKHRQWVLLVQRENTCSHLFKRRVRMTLWEHPVLYAVGMSRLSFTPPTNVIVCALSINRYHSHLRVFFFESSGFLTPPTPPKSTRARNFLKSKEVYICRSESELRNGQLVPSFTKSKKLTLFSNGTHGNNKTNLLLLVWMAA